MRSLTIFCLLLLVPALIFGTGSAGLATHASAKFTYQLQYPADWQTRSLAESGFFEASSQTDIASLPSIFRVDVVPLSAPLADYASHLRACVAEIRGELTEQGAKNIKILESREISLGNAVGDQTLEHVGEGPAGDEAGGIDVRFGRLGRVGRCGRYGRPFSASWPDRAGP